DDQAPEQALERHRDQQQRQRPPARPPARAPYARAREGRLRARVCAVSPLLSDARSLHDRHSIASAGTRGCAAQSATGVPPVSLARPEGTWVATWRTAPVAPVR